MLAEADLRIAPDVALLLGGQLAKTATARAFANGGDALAFARRLADGAPLALRYTKQAINAGIKAAALQSFDVSTALEIATLRSDDHREALAAIREKRKPDFKGR